MTEMKERFGFGCMRLPVMEKGKPDSFDYETIEKLFDMYLQNGFTYFDTAYTYHGYHGEEALRKALTERYPRQSFELVTKLPLRDFKDEADMERIFREQLEHCGVSYFDYYLLHNMGSNVYEKCRRYDAFHFVKKKKEEGKILHTGMSFHDMPELLEKILEEYADCIDFIQLQVNYMDMFSPNVQADACLAVARKYGKPVTVMEPCKGGTLVNVPKEAEELMKAYAPDTSTASWALRFAAMQPGVSRVLSGMGSPDQVEDNCGTFKDFKPLNDDELSIIHQVVTIINQNTAFACTACEYCTHDCPKNIPIPQYFALYNSIRQTTGDFSSQNVYYNNLIQGSRGKASDCIRCGLCEKACPQHLTIRDNLKLVAEQFEAGNAFPVRAR